MGINTKNDMNLNIRFPRDMWKKYLIDMDNYSEFCRDAIIKKIEREFNEKYHLEQIEFHKNKIKEQKEKIKEINISNKDKIKECFTYWNDVFKNKTFSNQIELERTIERQVLPNVKKLGYEGTSKDIAELFLNWPEE